jgi:serine/threonine protein phosphatase PrpC
MSTQPHLKILRVAHMGYAHEQSFDPSDTGLQLGMQDAHVVLQHARGIVAVVCDGSSDAHLSGTGAVLWAQAVADAVGVAAEKATSVVDLDWTVITEAVRAHMARIACAIYGTHLPPGWGVPREALPMLMATVLVVVTVDDKYVLAHCGDGYFLVDGVETDCGDVYLTDLVAAKGTTMLMPLPAYPLCANPFVTPDGRDLCAFRVHASGLLANIRTLALASDGLRPFLRKPYRQSFIEALEMSRTESTKLAGYMTACMNRSSRCAEDFSDDMTVIVLHRM